MKEEMTPTSDNLSVKTEKVYENNSLKKRTEFSYDAYGNVVEKKEYKNDTEYIRTGYNYTDTQYNGQYNGANLVGQTVYNVSDIDGNSNDTNVSYEYDWRGYPTKMIDADVNNSQVSRHKKAQFFRGSGYFVCSQYKASASLGVSILSVPCGLFVL